MSRPDGALQRVESYQWPAAHVGHLNEGQQNALDRFKQECEEKGYYTPRSADGATPASHDEETLLRYLRARKFIPHEAFGQFKETEDWRNENDLDGLYETIDVEEYEQTRRLYPQWTGRRDKRGIPFYVYQISDVDTKAVSASSSKDAKKGSQSASKTPRHLLCLFALYENLCRFTLPLCSAIPDRPISETPISQSSNLVDLSKVGFTKFWSLRTHMSAASQLATAHYPETLDRIFVVGAPSFFPTVWEWAKKWFDPITVSKIFILSDKNMTETLEKFVDIQNIPVKYGGKLDWKFGDMPFIEPQIVNALHWREQTTEKGHRTWPKGPIKWQYDESGDLVAMAIGSENGKPRRRVLAGLHPQAGIATLALSPGRASSDQVRPNISSAAGVAGPRSSLGGRNSLDSSTATRSSNHTTSSKASTVVAASTLGTDNSNRSSIDQKATRSFPPQINRAKDYEAPVQDNYALLAQRSRDDVPPEQPAPPPMQQTVSPPAQREVQRPLQQDGQVMPQTMSMWRGSGVGDAPRTTNNINHDHNVNAFTTTNNNHPIAPLSQETVGPSLPPMSDSSPPVVGSTPSIPREGTSATRYEQQAGTHAEGNSAGPAMKLDGAGEGHSVIEPNTVGQAPKEHSLPKNEDEAPAPGLMVTAQQYATVAYQQAAQLPSTVLAAVGIGGGSGATREGAQQEAEPEAETKAEIKREYPEIDRLDGSTVEQFLRSQVVSHRKK